METCKAKVRLLLVDDEEEFLEATAPGLERRGFAVELAQDGLMALRILADHPVDVIILDVKMPGIDGVDVFHKVKQLYPHLPVIMLTGHGTIQQAFTTSKEGVFDYLAKPCEIEELVEIARRAIQQSRPIPPAGPLLEEEIRLLLVDANPDFVASLSQALQQRGIKVITAAHAAEAKAHLERQRFDVALIEVKTSGQAGLPLLRLIKQHSPLTQILVLSDQPLVETVVEGLKEGAFDFLIKPLKVEVITQKICAAFRVLQQKKEAHQLKEVELLRQGRPD